MIVKFPERGLRFRVYIYTLADPEQEEIMEWGAYTSQDRAQRVLDMLESCGIVALCFDDRPPPPRPPPHPGGPKGFTFEMPQLKIRPR